MTYNGLYAIKPNQTKQNYIFLTLRSVFVSILALFLAKSYFYDRLSYINIFMIVLVILI